MDRNYAQSIVKWNYKGQYSIYNLEDTQQSINELLCGDYYSVSNGETVIGFYCFGKSAQVPIGNSFGAYDNKEYIDIGLGLKPDYCGKGLGLSFLHEGLGFAKRNLHIDRFRLTVASFNVRAINVYQKAGFRVGMSFKRMSDNEAVVEFLTMTLG